MRILVSGATTTFEELAPSYASELGALITPTTGNSPQRAINLGLPWACDNGCFPASARGGFNETKFLRMVERAAELPLLMWVAVPDSVKLIDGIPIGNAVETREMFDVWEPRLRGVPLAYVGQDGCAEPPWSRIVAVFLGGSTAWKLGPDAAALADEAKQRGKLVHMGRVNSCRRITHAHRIGCDSVDGTSTSMFPRIKIPLYSEHLRKLQAV